MSIRHLLKFGLYSTSLLFVCSPMRQANAQILEIYTDNGTPIPTWEFKSKTVTDRAGRTFTYTGEFYYAFDTKKNKWRTTNFIPKQDFTPAQQTAINTQTVNFYQQFGAISVLPTGFAPTIGSDCHGFTFKKEKQVGITGNYVTTILNGQGYQKLTRQSDAVIGDVIVYRKNGSITHTATVAEVVNGRVTLVDSKWGSLGTYRHAPTVVPGIYGGVAEYWQKGNAQPLADPAGDEDITDFDNLPAVTEDAALTTIDEEEVNDFASAKLNLDTQNGTQWNYSLEAPDQGLLLNSGDVVTLYASGITGATLTGEAASLLWNVTYGNGFASWQYQGNAMTFDTDLSGFQISSLSDVADDAYYRDAINGSLGRTLGPAAVPEPGVPALLFGMLGPGTGFLLLRRHKR